MSDTETILQAVRAWHQAGASADGDLTDAQVIPAQDKGPRPALPYLTVDVLVSDLVDGRDEARQTFADVLTVIAAGSTGSVFAITVDGEAISYTRLAGETTSTIATALAAALRAALPEVSARATGAAITIVGMWEAVAVATADTKLSLVEDAISVAGVSGERSGTVSVQGFGSGAESWLERAAIALRLPAIDEALDASGLSVFPLGGITDLSQFLDTSIEPRFSREYTVTYRIRIEPEAFDTALLASLAITDETRDGDEITITDEIDLEA